MSTVRVIHWHECCERVMFRSTSEVTFPSHFSGAGVQASGLFPNVGHFGHASHRAVRDGDGLLPAAICGFVGDAMEVSLSTVSAL